VSLHLFGILLACKHHYTLLSASSVAEARTLLATSIDTMRVLERTSLMSQKARKCLVGLLEVFDSFGTSSSSTVTKRRLTVRVFLSTAASDQTYTSPVENQTEGVAPEQINQSMFSFIPTAEEYVSQYIA
jgi:hypothetical protein